MSAEIPGDKIGPFRRATERLIPSARSRRLEIARARANRDDAYNNFGDVYGGRVSSKALNDVLEAETRWVQVGRSELPSYVKIGLTSSSLTNHSDVPESVLIGLNKYWMDEAAKQEKKEPFAALESLRRAKGFENATEQKKLQY